MTDWRVSAVLSVALLVCANGAAAEPAPDRPPCFYPNQMQSWRATQDSKTIYVRVGANKLYRMDLTAPCATLQLPMASLEFQLRGASAYCSAMSFELWARQPHGAPEYCSVARLSLLGAGEAAALPKNLRP